MGARRFFARPVPIAAIRRGLMAGSRLRMIDCVAARGTNGLRRAVAVSACFALVACNEDLSAALKGDEAAVAAARAQLLEDRQAGNDAATATDATAFSAAVKKLRYDRQATPGISNKGW